MNATETPTKEPSMVIALHAAERWTERVDRGASVREAKLALGRFVSLGRARPTPRHWMRGRVRQEPGTTFIYNAGRPNVCAVSVDGVVVTVLTRDLFSPRSRHLSIAPGPPAPAPATERARWRWYGQTAAELDEAA